DPAWLKIFAEGTKLILTPPDRNFDEDVSPKPTIFLPSMAEMKFHKSGTYLCLLENFFPDVIKIDWKEKNGNRILISQQGNTIKTKDTYMTYTWMTRTKRSTAKEHKCIVKHENNKGKVDQEILFRSMKKELAAIKSIEASLKDENDPLQLQLVSTSAYYTYVLLLAKSVVYSILIAICPLVRPALCDNGAFLIHGGTRI
ncbi:T-cell receptor gamma alternate reading frame protein, partial [Crocuta crocuta]